MKVTLMKKSKDPWSGVYYYRNCKHHIGSYWTRSGKRSTGLSKEDRERLEGLLDHKLDPDSEFWTTFSITLEEKKPTVVLDTDYPWEELQYKFLKGHKNVANGYTDKKASADYILVEEKATAQEVMKTAQVRIKALTEYSKMTTEQMYKCLRLYGHRSENASLEVVQSALYQLVEENPSKFLQVWVNNENKEIQYIIEEAVAKNILRKNKTTYKYGTDIVGYTLEDSIEYLKNPANSTIKLGILSQIQGKEESLTGVTTEVKKSELSKLKEEINKEVE